ncbi:MAG: hypothetical protein OXF25_02975 [Cyanobacteria bacterium MAG CAR3_bin_5]|nr:hypothetical protein [Cyanobacteria bacterium MAG CAR3_bin_5]
MATARHTGFSVGNDRGRALYQLAQGQRPTARQARAIQGEAQALGFFDLVSVVCYRCYVFGTFHASTAFFFWRFHCRQYKRNYSATFLYKKATISLLILYFILNLIEQNLKPELVNDALQRLHFIEKWQWQWGYISTQPLLYHWLFKIFVDVCNFLNFNFKFEAYIPKYPPTSQATTMASQNLHR